ncbi:MAG: deaminase [Christensenellales bacterium]
MWPGDGRIIARAHNLRESSKDPTAHAEILAMRRAAKSWGMAAFRLYFICNDGAMPHVCGCCGQCKNRACGIWRL